MNNKVTISVFTILMLVGLAPFTMDVQAASDEPKQEQAASTQNSDSLWTRDKLLGDAGGVRSTLGEYGVEVDIHFSQYFQQVVGGGNDTGGAYGGIFDYIVKVDGHKLGLWEGLIASMHVQTQVGSYDSYVGKAGAMALSNTQLLYPLPGDDRTEITGWTIGQFLTKEIMIFGGKLHTIDLQTGFFPHLDYGFSGFMNTNVLAPALPWFRFVELSMIGGGIQRMDPQGRGVQSGVLFFDAQNSSTTSGFDSLFNNAAALVFWREYFDIDGKPGNVTFALGGSTKAYSELEQSSWLLGSTSTSSFVFPNGFKEEKNSGAWAFTTYLNQVLWQDGPKGDRNILLYTGFGVGPDSPGIASFSIFGTLEATGFFDSRPKDKIGVGGFYNNLSDALTETAKLLRNPIENNTSGAELYYNAEIVPWMHLTANIQFINSATKSADTSIIPGLRLVTDF